MTVGSLFSGIGGFDLGLERAGMQVKWQVEIDKYCLKVLEKHWPHVRRYTDIKQVRWEDVEPVDLVCGGFPCQPVSVAGKRKGREDERWLWPEFVRCFGVLRPRYVLIENVPGLLVRGFADVLRDLAACGYDAEWDCIPAAQFQAPHLRERVWILAYSASSRLQRQVSVFGKTESILPQTSNNACFDTFRERFSTSRSCGNVRIGDGIPYWVDRLRGLGNAVVPQVVTWIGERIMEQQGERKEG